MAQNGGSSLFDQTMTVFPNSGSHNRWQIIALAVPSIQNNILGCGRLLSDNLKQSAQDFAILLFVTKYRATDSYSNVGLV